MDTALSAPAASAPVMITPVDAQPNFVQRLNGLPLRSKLTMGAGLLALAGAVLAITLWSSQGDYRPLYSGLTDKDGGEVIGQLSALQVPYKHEAGGTNPQHLRVVNRSEIRLGECGRDRRRDDDDSG